MNRDVLARTLPDITVVVDRLPSALAQLPRPDWGRLGRVAEDAAYITVGFGVLGVQRLQVFRRDLERSLRGN